MHPATAEAATVATTQDGKEAFVRRDSVALQGAGLIGLGHLPEPQSPDAILYRLED